MMLRLRRLSHKAICLLLLFLVFFESPGGVPAAHATPTPDLEIWRLSFDPSDPLIWNAVTAEVVVNNTGTDPSAVGTTVSLEWCCGQLSRSIGPLAVGESVLVEFRHALVFTEPGDYEITVVVDPDNRISELDETNNNVTELLTVALRVEAPLEVEPGDWDAEGEPLPLLCPDNDLMEIGRRRPFVRDSEGRLIREDNTPPPEWYNFTHVYLDPQVGPACGTTCLAYILRYFGKECCHAPCVQECIDEDIRASWAGGEEGMYTDPIAIKEYAESKRLNAEIYVDGDLQEVRSFVDRGIPVMLDIIATAGSTDVWEGHWVVVVSFCEVPQEFPPGTTKTIIGIYCPHGRQFGITPERLEQFWGRVEFPFWPKDIHLWTRLYIAISDQDLPPGNTDKVRGQLAMARGISTVVRGAFDLWDVFTDPGERLGWYESMVEMEWGFYVAVCAALSMVYSWGGDLPLIGGMFAAAGEYCGSLALVIDDLVNIAADLLNPLNWFDFERMGELLLDLAGVVWDFCVAYVKLWRDFIVDGIVGLLVGLWDGLTAATCWAFDWGCPSIVVYYKHYVSTDPCLETTIFIPAGLRRNGSLGYIYTYPALGAKPIWLYTNSTSSPSDRRYYLRDDGDWQQTDPSMINLGMIGYSRISPIPGNFVNLTLEAINYDMLGGGNLGYLLQLPEPGTTILWLMESLESGAFTVSTDPCAMTQTFITPVVQGYTRELPVGLIPPSETEGAVKLYRFFNPSTEDCLLSTSVTSREGYVNQGYLGYIYTELGTDRVPLYQFYNSKYRDHLITTDPNAEGLDGYGSREVLGYVLSTSDLEPEDWTCNAPLWRFCKRIRREE